MHRSQQIHLFCLQYEPIHGLIQYMLACLLGKKEIDTNHIVKAPLELLKPYHHCISERR